MVAMTEITGGHNALCPYNYIDRKREKGDRRFFCYKKLPVPFLHFNLPIKVKARIKTIYRFLDIIM